jgi:hypothetical protein
VTFDEIKASVADRMNLTSTASLTRVGKSINEAYKMVCSSIGVQAVARQNGVTANTVIGTPTLAFGPSPTKVLKIITLYYNVTTPPLILTEQTVETIRQLPSVGDPATAWAPYQTTATSVTVLLNSTPASIYTLTADVYSTQATLSGSQEPAFAEPFHDMLELVAMAIELEKMEKYDAAKVQWDKFRGEDGSGGRLSEYRMYMAVSAFKDIVQGARPVMSQWPPMVT